ncbi:hypothetical protein pb186bvf_011487 [Paramecium bursaria]
MENSFIFSLYNLLENSEQDCICWSFNGASFIVKNRQGLQRLLHQYFNHNNINSFLRQLSGYGFKMQKYDGYKQYSHKLFRQGCKLQLGQISRLTKGVSEITILRRGTKDMLHELQQIQIVQQKIIEEIKSQISQQQQLIIYVQNLSYFKQKYQQQTQFKMARLRKFIFEFRNGLNPFLQNRLLQFIVGQLFFDINIRDTPNRRRDSLLQMKQFPTDLWDF